MTDYTGKLLYRKESPTIVEILGYICIAGVGVTDYAVNVWDATRVCKAERWDTPIIDYSVVHGYMHVINIGATIVSPVGVEGVLTELRPKFLWEKYLDNGNVSGTAALTYENFFKYGWKFDFEKRLPAVVLTNNKNRATCFNCKCHTELRRDFTDMSVREFCPRCKI